MTAALCLFAGLLPVDGSIATSAQLSSWSSSPRLRHHRSSTHGERGASALSKGCCLLLYIPSGIHHYKGERRYGHTKHGAYARQGSDQSRRSCKPQWAMTRRSTAGQRDDVSPRCPLTSHPRELHENLCWLTPHSPGLRDRSFPPSLHVITLHQASWLMRQNSSDLVDGCNLHINDG